MMLLTLKKLHWILLMVGIHLMLAFVHQAYVTTRGIFYTTANVIGTLQIEHEPVDNYTNIYNYSSTTLYLYNSNFENLYQFIYDNCEAIHPMKEFQHIPDSYFFDDIKRGNIKINGTQVNVATTINELDTKYSSSKHIVFVVPIWNDIIGAMSLKWHINKNYCFKAANAEYGTRKIRQRVLKEIRKELKQKLSEFETYRKLHPEILVKYITIFHGWFYPNLWNQFVLPLYVKNNMFIAHYEHRVSEGSTGKSKLYNYKRITVAPYMSPLYLSSNGSIDLDEDKTIVNDLYFSGGLRSGMFGAMLRIKACKLNQIEGVNVNYLNITTNLMEGLKSHNWTDDGETSKNIEKCLVSNNVHEKHPNQTFNDTTYLNELKQSRFCLFFRGDSYSARRFYDMLYTNCIPVIISDKWLKRAAPFRNIVDYNKMCYFIEEKAFKQDPVYEISKILKLKPSEWQMKLQYLKQNKHHLIWSANDSTVTQNIFLSLFN